MFLPNQDLSRSLENEKKSSEAVLLRLFPSLSGKSDLEVEAQEALEAMSKGEAHYKNVLAQTDSMLTSLQASVETAEAEWRLKLEAANKLVKNRNTGSFTITVQKYWLVALKFKFC